MDCKLKKLLKISDPEIVKIKARQYFKTPKLKYTYHQRRTKNILFMILLIKSLFILVILDTKISPNISTI